MNSYKVKDKVLGSIMNELILYASSNDNTVYLNKPNLHSDSDLLILELTNILKQFQGIEVKSKINWFSKFIHKKLKHIDIVKTTPICFETDEVIKFSCKQYDTEMTGTELLNYYYGKED